MQGKTTVHGIQKFQREQKYKRLAYSQAKIEKGSMNHQV